MIENYKIDVASVSRIYQKERILGDIDELDDGDNNDKVDSNFLPGRSIFEYKASGLLQKPEFEKRAPRELLQDPIQPPDSYEKRVTCQPKGVNLEDITSYAHEEELQDYIRIYVIDSGLNKKNMVNVPLNVFGSMGTNNFLGVC